MKEIDLAPQGTSVDKQKRAFIQRNQEEAKVKQQKLGKDDVEVTIGEADKLRQEGYEPLAAYYKGTEKVYKLRKPKESKK